MSKWPLYLFQTNNKNKKMDKKTKFYTNISFNFMEVGGCWTMTELNYTEHGCDAVLLSRIENGELRQWSVGIHCHPGNKPWQTAIENVLNVMHDIRILHCIYEMYVNFVKFRLWF